MQALVFVVATIAGLVLAFVDTRPGWDDTGVMAMALMGAAAALGAASPARAWLWALALGAWIPVFNIASIGNYGSLLALPIAVVAAYAGAAVRQLFGAARA